MSDVNGIPATANRSPKQHISLYDLLKKSIRNIRRISFGEGQGQNNKQKN